MALPLAFGRHDPQAVTARLSYASFVSTRHRLLFVETPKACSSTMKWVLAELTGTEVALQLAEDTTELSGCIHDRQAHTLPALTDLPADLAQEVLESPDYLRVCAVRNPFARLISAWADKIRLIEPGFEEPCREALKHAGREGANDAPTFKEFANWVVDTNDPTNCDPHWQSQTALTFPELIDYNYILRAESFEQDLQGLLAPLDPGWRDNAIARIRANTHNVSLPPKWSETYDEDLAGRVAEFYGPTFERFGYSRDSWKSLVERPDPDPAIVASAALRAVRARNAVISEWNRRQPIRQVRAANWSATRLAKAAARWLIRRFSAGSSSAKVRSAPSGTKTGS